jgi:hypothetical protein
MQPLQNAAAMPSCRFLLFLFAVFALLLS